MPLNWSKIRKGLLVLAAVVAGGVVLLFGLFSLLIIYISRSDPNRKRPEPTAYRTTELYLRNRTAAPLRVSLRVPRTHLTLDTAWWGVGIGGTAVGRAVVVRGSAVDVLHARLRRPVLLAGSADTLVSSPEYAYLGGSGPRQLFHLGQRPDRWLERLRQPPLALAETVWAEPLPGQPDTLRLTFAVAPDSSLLLVRHLQAFYQEDFYPDGEPVESSVAADPALPRFLLRPTVRWQDGRHRPHRQLVPLTPWLREPPFPKSQLPTKNQRRVQYLDVR